MNGFGEKTEAQIQQELINKKKKIQETMDNIKIQIFKAFDKTKYGTWEIEIKTENKKENTTLEGILQDVVDYVYSTYKEDFDITTEIKLNEFKKVKKIDADTLRKRNELMFKKSQLEDALKKINEQLESL
jgi:hypothetical protein